MHSFLFIVFVIVEAQKSRGPIKEHPGFSWYYLNWWR